MSLVPATPTVDMLSSIVVVATVIATTVVGLPLLLCSLATSHTVDNGCCVFVAENAKI